MKRQWKATVTKKFSIEDVGNRYVVTDKRGVDLFAPEYCYIDKTFANFDFPFASNEESMYWDIKEIEVKPA